MERVPKAGEPLNDLDIVGLLSLMGEVKKKQPTLELSQVIGFVLANAGERYRVLTCQEGEWSSLKGDFGKEKGAEAKCPQGHDIYIGVGLQLGWVADGVVGHEQDEDNCNVYYEVDFGEGPVRVRCTNVGRHKEHSTETVFR